MSKALVIIDLQNDYFPGGAYPLWNADQTLANIKSAVASAKGAGIPIVIVQHVADPSQGPSPFFNAGSHGVEVHSELRELVPDAPVVIKAFADSFEQTNLREVLGDARHLMLCGMMTQNCVTHTALSKAAEAYEIDVLVDCCTTVDEMLHLIAVHALSTRVALKPAAEAIAA